MFATDPWRTRIAASHLFGSPPAPPDAACVECSADCADLVNIEGARYCPRCGRYVEAVPVGKAPCEEPPPVRFREFL